jgi:hypothetical protein
MQLLLGTAGQGLMPACVEASNGALVFGDLQTRIQRCGKCCAKISPFDANKGWVPNRASTTSCEVGMLELAIKGSKTYWHGSWPCWPSSGWGSALLWQLQYGLGITGMSRDVSWGFYIANFTYLVGVAAGGVMVVLPYYLHDYKAYGRITIMGEFLAIAA